MSLKTKEQVFQQLSKIKEYGDGFVEILTSLTEGMETKARTELNLHIGQIRLHTSDALYVLEEHLRK